MQTIKEPLTKRACARVNCLDLCSSLHDDRMKYEKLEFKCADSRSARKTPRVERNHSAYTHDNACRWRRFRDKHPREDFSNGTRPSTASTWERPIIKGRERVSTPATNANFSDRLSGRQRSSQVQVFPQGRLGKRTG